MKKKILKQSGFGLCLLVAIMVFYASCHKIFQAPDPSTHTISKKIQYGFTLQNTTNQNIKKAEFQVYAPVLQTATQQCADLSSSHPYEATTKENGNQMLCFTVMDLPPYASKVISIKATLLLSNQPHNIPTHDLNQYLKPEKYIETDDPEIQQFSKRFAKGHSIKTASRIFEWVSNHLTYTGYAKNSRGARYALLNKKGDCTEFMYLFVALCRARNIPARCISGYLSGDGAVIKPVHYHNWAEVYIDGKWVLSDPQRKVFADHAPDYIAMKIMTDLSPDTADDFERYRVIGKGLTVKMNT